MDFIKTKEGFLVRPITVDEEEWIERVLTALFSWPYAEDIAESSRCTEDSEQQ